MPVYLVGYAKSMLYSEQPTNLLARKHLNTMLLTNFKHFSRNTQFLSFDGPSNYLYLFKNHQQTFPWPGERPSSHIKVTKIWFAPNIKYLLESCFMDFCCPEVISCIWYEKYLCWFRTNSLKSNKGKFQFMILSHKNQKRKQIVIYSITVRESNEVILLGIT